MAKRISDIHDVYDQKTGKFITTFSYSDGSTVVLRPRRVGEIPGIVSDIKKPTSGWETIIAR